MMSDMSLTKSDLRSIKELIDSSIDERVPKIIDERVSKIIDERVPGIIDERVPGVIQPMLDKLEGRLANKIDDLTLQVGQFSQETTDNFNDLRFGIDKLAGRQNRAIGQIRKGLKNAAST